MDNTPEEVHKLLRGEVQSCARDRMLTRKTPLGDDPEALRQGLAVLVDNGYFGIVVPTSYGGEGGGWQEASIIVDETARAEPVLAMMLAAHLACCSGVILWGDGGQKERFLPSLAAADALGGVAMTEPEAGSDYAAVRAAMETRGERLVINGNKCFVTNTGPELDPDGYILTICRGERGLGAVVVPSNAPGFHLAHRYLFAGWDGLPNHAVVLQDCAVPAENLLRDGMGEDELEALLDGARLLTTAIAAGMAAACMDEAAGYAKERRQGGKMLVEHQGVHFQLADMATSTELMRTGLMLAAAALDGGRPCHPEIAMLKLFSTTRLEEVASSAMEIAGGYGYTTDSRLSSLYRDAKGLQLFWGTRNLMRLEIASTLR